MKRLIFFTIILTASLLFIHGLPLHAASIKTAVFTFARDNCEADISSKVESRVRRGLGPAKYVKLAGTGEVDKALKGKPCAQPGCAIAACKELGIERAVTGSVSGSTRESASTMGDSGKDQYLIKVTQKNTYTITVALWDSKTGKRLGAFSKSAGEDDINAAADYLAEKLAGLYVEEKKEEAKKTRDKKSVEKKSVTGAPVRGVLGVSPSCIIPAGDLTRLAGPGGGFYLYGGIMNALFDNSLIMVSTGFWYLSERGDVKSMYTSQVSLVLGYSFTLPKNFSIAPLLGAGYHFHIAERDEEKLYYDPFLSLRCEAGYMVYDSLYVTLTPAYSLFFEKSGVGMYVTIEAGVKYLF